MLGEANRSVLSLLIREPRFLERDLCSLNRWKVIKTPVLISLPIHTCNCTHEHRHILVHSLCFVTCWCILSWCKNGCVADWWPWTHHSPDADASTSWMPVLKKKKSLQEFYTVLGSRAHLSQFYSRLAVDASLALSIWIFTCPGHSLWSLFCSAVVEWLSGDSSWTCMRVFAQTGFLLCCLCSVEPTPDSSCRSASGASP